jgi:hypothetical protein
VHAIVGVIHAPRLLRLDGRRASATIVCIGLGSLFALGVFLVPIERAMGWSRGAI